MLNTIHVCCSWSPTTKDGTYHGCIRIGRSETFVDGFIFGSTPDRCVLSGVLECLEKSPEGIHVTVVVPTKQKFKSGVPFGANCDLKKQILELAKSRNINLQWRFRMGDGDYVRRMSLYPCSLTAARQ